MTPQDMAAEERRGARKCFRCERHTYEPTPLFGGDSHLCPLCAWCHELEIGCRHGWRRRLLRPVVHRLIKAVDRIRDTFTQPR